MIRLGLCCIFVEQPIKYRQVTAAHLLTLPRDMQVKKISDVCLHNVHSLGLALDWLHDNGVGAYRVPSPLFPRYTHPAVGYDLEELPDAEEIFSQLRHIKLAQQQKKIRLSLHPDQFNVLSSPKDGVVKNTLKELEYQGLVAELIGADVINIHAGGAYGNKDQACLRFRKNFERLSERVRTRLTLENDDRTYTVADLLPLCESIGRPLVYDIHHHRCLPDSLSQAEAAEESVKLWERYGEEPYFHISSPLNGWMSGNPRPHADYIDIKDFPDQWRDMRVTVDVEAKAKELALLKLNKDLAKQAAPV